MPRHYFSNTLETLDSAGYRTMTPLLRFCDNRENYPVPLEYELSPKRHTEIKSCESQAGIVTRPLPPTEWQQRLCVELLRTDAAECYKRVVELLGFNLRASGFEVACAFSGAEALLQARKLLPDLIVLDLMLPELHGTAVCEILRRWQETASIPVLMLTACTQATTRTIAFKAGVDEFMTKPFSPQALVGRVNDLIARKRTLNQHPLANVALNS